MRVFLLILFGALGALGILRGLELVATSGEFRQALFPLAIGLLLAILFAQQWKSKKKPETQSTSE